MGYQTGTVGPITYNQDNSGNANDTDTPVKALSRAPTASRATWLDKSALHDRRQQMGHIGDHAVVLDVGLSVAWPFTKGITS